MSVQLHVLFLRLCPELPAATMSALRQAWQTPIAEGLKVKELSFSAPRASQG